MSGTSVTIGEKVTDNAKSTAKAAYEAAQIISTLSWQDQQIENLKKQRRADDIRLAKYLDEQIKAGNLKLGVVYRTSAGAFVAFTNAVTGCLESMSVAVEDTVDNEPIPF